MKLALIQQVNEDKETKPMTYMTYIFDMHVLGIELLNKYMCMVFGIESFRIEMKYYREENIAVFAKQNL